MTTHSSILAWEIPWTEDFGHYGVQESTFPLHVSGDSIEENPQSLFWEKTKYWILWVKNISRSLKNFFFKFIFISWRLITLQYCSGFCHTLTWLSHGFTCVIPIPPPSSLPIQSLWVFPAHQPWALVSCIQPGLVKQIPFKLPLKEKHFDIFEFAFLH